MSAAKESQTTPSNDIAALAEVVNLSQRPTSVQWQKAMLGAAGLGPTDWSLTAVLRYTHADAEAVRAASKPAPHGTEVPEVGAWLAEDVRQALAAAPTAYEATAFFKSPLVHGALFDLGDGERFLLHLYTM